MFTYSDRVANPRIHLEWELNRLMGAGQISGLKFK